MSIIGCDIALSTLSKKNTKHTKQPNLNELALWILQVCYNRYHPSSLEIAQVKKELKKIYAYEGIPF